MLEQTSSLTKTVDDENLRDLLAKLWEPNRSREMKSDSNVFLFCASSLWEATTSQQFSQNAPFTKWLTHSYLQDMGKKSLWQIVFANNVSGKSISADAAIDVWHAALKSETDIQQLTGCLLDVEMDLEKVVELEVAKKFKNIMPVQLIYTDEYLGRKRFLVLTTNCTYDDSLMDDLLSVERDIHLSYDLPTSFLYIPAIVEAHDAVPVGSKLIYERGANVSGASSFVAGGSERTLSYAAAK